MADRFSVARSRYDLQPEGSPPHLIDFTIRGARGAVKGRDTMDERMARHRWRQLGALLGHADVPLVYRDAQVLHRLLDTYLRTERSDPDWHRLSEICDALAEYLAEQDPHEDASPEEGGPDV